MNELCLPSPAKINLFLHVVGRRPDGYHSLQTVFQFVDLCDTFHFKLRTDDRICLHSNLKNVPMHENLIFRAAALLQQKTKTCLGIDVSVQKNIPIGGGLGGGSSNAATTLLALNTLWKLRLTTEQLQELAVQLGADVPIFIHGRAAFAEGIGEQFQSINPREYWYLILIPACEVATAKIFSDPQLTRNTPAITIAEFFERGGHNDCELIAKKHYPEIEKALNWLNQYAPAKMTGTGSCVFAAFDEKTAAQEVAGQVPSEFNSVVVKGLNNSPVYKVLCHAEKT